MATIQARNAVALSCFKEGYASAARKFTIDEKTARTLWNEWAESRERDLPSSLPEFLGLYLVRVAGADRTIVVDLGEATVLDLLESSAIEAVDLWLKRMDDQNNVDQVAISLHLPYREAVQRHLPYAEVMICRQHAEAAISHTFLRSFQRLCVPLAQKATRNVREDPDLFMRRSHQLTDTQREQMSGWSDDILTLYDARETALFALSLRRPEDAARMLEQVAKTCRELLGSRGVAQLLETWGEEMAAAVAEPTAQVTGQLAMIIHALQKMRTLPFPLARGFLVLKEEQRPARKMLTPFIPDSRPRGVDMEDIIVALT